MSKYADSHRSKEAKSRVDKMTKQSDEKYGASGWKPPTDEKANVQTGMRPVSRQAYKKGGAVMGAKASHHPGRKARAEGGKALTADSLINRDAKEANEKRAGEKHDGGLKRGGRSHKDMGGQLQPLQVQPPQNAGPIGGGLYGMKSNPVRSPLLKKGGKAEAKEVSGTRPTGDRIARASGGKASKGKMNVNIIIGGHGDKPPVPPMMPPPPMPPQGSPMVPPPPPAGAMPPPMPPGGMPMRPPGQ
jgi:hypothetical protein